jgi:hypothetical protein
MTSELLTVIAKHSYSSEELEKVFYYSINQLMFIFMFIFLVSKVKAFVMNNSNELEAGGVNRILAAVKNNLFWLDLTSDNFRGAADFNIANKNQ